MVWANIDSSMKEISIEEHTVRWAEAKVDAVKFQGLTVFFLPLEASHITAFHSSASDTTPGARWRLASGGGYWQLDDGVA